VEEEEEEEEEEEYDEEVDNDHDIHDETDLKTTDTNQNLETDFLNSNRLSNSQSNAKSQRPLSIRQDNGIVGRVWKQDHWERADEIYFIGIIDILQQYTISKHSEHVLKSFTFDSHEISCVDPDTYAERFVHFIETSFD